MINIDTQQPTICTHPQSFTTNQAGLTSVSHQLHCKQVNKACAPQMIKVRIKSSEKVPGWCHVQTGPPSDLELPTIDLWHGLECRTLGP